MCKSKELFLVFGQEMDVEKEWEFKCFEEDMGWKVSIEYVDGLRVVMRNVTEVHWNFKEGRFAVESRVHGGGVVNFRDRVERVSIFGCEVSKMEKREEWMGEFRKKEG